jgi:serine/threonine protein kinase
MSGVVLGELLARSDVLDVFAGWSPERACPVVVKRLRPDRRDDAEAAAALQAEGELLLALRHPHLVAAYEVLPGPVVVLEMLGGETLARMVQRRRRRLSAREVAFLGSHLCSAVHHLHARGILHLDLKPSNVVAHAGRAILIDLSIARPPGVVPAGLGTWCYLSPEQARGGDVSAAADVWGLGAVLWEAATGEPAFGDGRDTAPFPQLGRRADPVGSRRPRLPRALAQVIDASLDPDPAARPSVGALMAACTQAAGAYLDTMTTSAPTTPAATTAAPAMPRAA